LNDRSPSRPSVTVAIVVGLLLTAEGCARIVTISPTDVGHFDDTAWKVRQAPGTDSEVPKVVSPIVGAAEVSFRARPEVQQALQTPPDEFGIPSGLYAVDPLLRAHRGEFESETSARHSVAAGTIVFGLVCAGIAAVVIGLDAPKVNSTDMQTQSSASQAVFWGALTGVLSLGEIAAGTVMAFSGSDPRSLQGYYRESYTDSR
jgi:hypothetical protein